MDIPIKGTREQVNNITANYVKSFPVAGSWWRLTWDPGLRHRVCETRRNLTVSSGSTAGPGGMVGRQERCHAPMANWAGPPGTDFKLGIASFPVKSQILIMFSFEGRT